jgi:DNA-binding NtrC family response regulator
MARILVVDDEPLMLSVLRRLLSRAGHEVALAADAREALALLEAAPADLVLSDVRMPGMDGRALLAQVHHRWPCVARLLVSADAAFLSAPHPHAGGGEEVAVLDKPFDADALLAAVEARLPRRPCVERGAACCAWGGARVPGLPALSACGRPADCHPTVSFRK